MSLPKQEDIQAAKEELQFLAKEENAKNKPKTLKDIVASMISELWDAKNNGYDYADIVDVLKSKEIEINENTLRTYMFDLRERASPIASDDRRKEGLASIDRRRKERRQARGSSKSKKLSDEFNL